MKKLLISFVLCCASLMCFAESKSELNENSSSLKIERLSGGKFKDDVELINKSFAEDVEFTLLIKKDGDWEVVGEYSLAKFDDQIKLMSNKFPKKIKPKDVTQVAIESLNENVFVLKGFIKDDNLMLEIRDEGTDLKKSVVPEFDNEDAFVFDGRNAFETFDENMKLRNKTTLKKLSFKVSVYDSKNGKWIYYGEAEVNGKNDVTKVKTKLKLKDYRYFAIEALDGESYNLMPIPEDDDLIINISL